MGWGVGGGAVVQPERKQYLGAERVWANVTQHTWESGDETISCHGDEVLQLCRATRTNKSNFYLAAAQKQQRLMKMYTNMKEPRAHAAEFCCFNIQRCV